MLASAAKHFVNVQTSFATIIVCVSIQGPVSLRLQLCKHKPVTLFCDDRFVWSAWFDMRHGCRTQRWQTLHLQPSQLMRQWMGMSAQMALQRYRRSPCLASMLHCFKAWHTAFCKALHCARLAHVVLMCDGLSNSGTVQYQTARAPFATTSRGCS